MGRVKNFGEVDDVDGADTVVYEEFAAEVGFDIFEKGVDGDGWDEDGTVGIHQYKILLIFRDILQQGFHPVDNLLAIFSKVFQAQ